MGQPGKAVLLASSLLAVALAGCLGGPDPLSPQNDGTASSGRARPTVVAVIDTGVNPYHEAFRAGPGQGVESYLPAFGLAEAVQLSSSGNYGERVEADKAVWDNVEPGRLYAFQGTRVMAISITSFPGDPPIRDVDGHGTETASLVAREAPDTVIVSIQTNNAFCPAEGGYCPIFAPVSQAMAWAAEQPWIDVISVSLGVPANPPMPGPLNPEIEAYVAASRLAHERGKVVVTGTGNTVAPPAASYFAGPPWVIAVGGVEAAPKGEGPDASKIPDVVANFSEYAATHNSVDAYDWHTGTSYATPIVAGTMARAIQEIRTALGHGGGIAADGALAQSESVSVGSKELRDALNASAVYFSATDWDPTKPTSNRTVGAPLYQSLPILVPHLQMGWGYVHSGLSGEIASRVLSGDIAVPNEKQDAAAHQARVQAVREAYWTG